MHWTRDGAVISFLVMGPRLGWVGKEANIEIFGICGQDILYDPE